MHHFRTVSDIRIERGGAARLDQHVEGLAGNRNILIITDPGLRKIGLLEAPCAALESAGFTVNIYDKVVADPPQDMVLAAAGEAENCKAGLIIGFGGGSSMDTAKVVAALAAGKQPIEQMYGVGKVTGPRLPLLLIPTTAGTGSEVTNVAILTIGAHEKKGIVDDVLYADRVLLDAELTLGLPPQITAATGIDAMVHAIEAYTSIRLKNPISDALALSALEKLRSGLVDVCRDGSDIDGREHVLIGAMLAGQAFSNAPCAAVHALAYPLGGFFHVPHGLSNALVLTGVLKYNHAEAAHWYSEIADHLRLPHDLIEEMERIKAATNVPQTLAEVNIPETAIEMMAEDAMTKDRLLVNNPRPMTLEATIKIYQDIAR